MDVIIEYYYGGSVLGRTDADSSESQWEISRWIPDNNPPKKYKLKISMDYIRQC